MTKRERGTSDCSTLPRLYPIWSNSVSFDSYAPLIAGLAWSKTRQGLPINGRDLGPNAPALLHIAFAVTQLLAELLVPCQSYSLAQRLLVQAQQIAMTLRQMIIQSLLDCLG